MVRAVVLLGVAVVAEFALGATIGWLTHRPKAMWSLVACVVNTVILSCVVLTIDQFRDEGLTLYSIFFCVVMVRLASVAANLGTTSIRQIRAQRDGW